MSRSVVRTLPVVLLVTILSTACGFGQKVKVGYDKKADFSKYKSYTWDEPGPQSRPFLYMTVSGSIRTARVGPDDGEVRAELRRVPRPRRTHASEPT